MKKSKKITALILSALLAVGTGLPVYAIDEPIGENPERQMNGYRFNDSVGAVIFDSWDDYVTYSPDAREVMKNDTYECYMKNHDYICVPNELKEKTDSISSIFITPEYCKVTFNIDSEEIDFSCFYYAGSIYKEPTSFSIAKKDGKKETIGVTEVYKYVTKWESNNYFEYDNCCYSVSTNFIFDSEENVRVAKIYTDGHFAEENGSLYYTDDNGEKASGWKTVNGHKYYFRLSDKTAVCGRKAEIDSIVYSFNEGGICTGKFSGYALYGNDKVYYKDGVIQGQNNTVFN